MQFRCRLPSLVTPFISAGASAASSSRLGPGRLVTLAVPEELEAAGSVGELISHWLGVAGPSSCGLVVRLAVAGFAVPENERVADVLRDKDEVTLWLSLETDASGGRRALTDAARPLPIAAGAASAEAEKAAARADKDLHALRKDMATQAAQAKADSVVAAAEKGRLLARIDALERQGAELQAKLVSAEEAASAREAALEERLAEAEAAQAGSSTSGPSTQPQESESEGAGLTQETKELKAATPTRKRRWEEVGKDAAARELQPGDLVRYKLRLLDPWQGTLRLTGFKTAKVESIRAGEVTSGGSKCDDPLVVLRRHGGALDCVEAAKLLELQLQVEDKDAASPS
eukprot:TRINITY_DN65929_c0_g1_i1.p1 TRINITY_DN65929_c0_g1~~TRINITY_DN65929_c0_g1_i1.p1  ORF type:complete len:345 (-),score=82.12 TRINITY_DN65929_c0_g1_i1:8-1042(-)